MNASTHLDVTADVNQKLAKTQPDSLAFYDKSIEKYVADSAFFFDINFGNSSGNPLSINPRVENARLFGIRYWKYPVHSAQLQLIIFDVHLVMPLYL